ncbi:hypothetical protein IJJ46_02880 [Candidatus Saccharibacteria bacterium]|nr:hypothetical protein [Candidatus Saccharibacteria bacterium]
MKQSDIITIILITMIGTIAAGFITNAVLGNPDDASEKWKTIETVSGDLSVPDPEVFNADAINPTVEVYVGNCEDRDQDGVLSEGELIACGWMSAKEIKNNTDKDNSSSNNSQNNIENDTESETEGQLTPEEILRRRTQTTPSTTNEDGQTVETLDGNSATPTVPGLTPSTETNSNASTDGGNSSSDETSTNGSQSGGGATVPGVEF